MKCVREHLTGNLHGAAILVFDLQDPKEASTWISEVGSDLKANCGTIAILDPPKRLPNIDRVVSPTADSAELCDRLRLIAERLTYTSSPPQQCSTRPSIDVRLIRKQHELMDYFKLRHRIYKIMGYLSEEIEHVPSQMEIDWCDTVALHIGAFVQGQEGNGSLAGTARVVVCSSEVTRKQPLLSRYQAWVTTLAECDPVLKRLVSRGVLPLELPIFQSQKLFGIMRESHRRKDVCAELSRVIVREDYRGMGLSNQLVDYALAEAAKVGVTRVFLECLALHEGLYGKLGFVRIPGADGTVLSVNQTMIGMELFRETGARETGVSAAS
jgi:GNAT superfamily N-acetyltransferase